MLDSAKRHTSPTASDGSKLAGHGSRSPAQESRSQGASSKSPKRAKIEVKKQAMASSISKAQSTTLAKTGKGLSLINFVPYFLH